MEKFVITIARQYGSGGKTIGEMLAKDLGIEYYNRDIIRKASEESGIFEGLFAKQDEKLNAGLLQRIVKKAYNGELITPDKSDFTSHDNLFNYQAKVIQMLAEEESCVIIGRCADYILRDRTDVLSVFVHAPMDFRMEQAAKKQNLTGKDLERFINKTDKERSEYYRYHTGRDWNDARNYDLCLNSDKLGFERCVEEIKAYLQIRFRG